ncbi:hypothetical protein Tco_0810569 [Tanacetum coccineum]
MWNKTCRQPISPFAHYCWPQSIAPAAAFFLMYRLHRHYLPPLTLLESTRPFLKGELENIDVNLPTLIAVLKSVGAGECWHKHGSFLGHLFDTYRILKLWGAPDALCLCGLFHSACFNSYLSLAIFDPSTGRESIRTHVGEVAE